MSNIKRWMETEADAAGLPLEEWHTEQIRISRDEAAFAAYWQDAELCANCGWTGVPERVRAGAEGLDICPGCGGVECFSLDTKDVLVDCDHGEAGHVC